VFCEAENSPNSFSAGVPPRTPLWDLQAPLVEHKTLHKTS